MRRVDDADYAHVTEEIDLPSRLSRSFLTSRGVAEIAEDVGYESEAAFNRAFKREFGLPPARYRNEHRTASGFAA